jgi:hypothetical protein
MGGTCCLCRAEEKRGLSLRVKGVKIYRDAKGRLEKRREGRQMES